MRDGLEFGHGHEVGGGMGEGGDGGAGVAMGGQQGGVERCRRCRTRGRLQCRPDGGDGGHRIAAPGKVGAEFFQGAAGAFAGGLGGDADGLGRLFKGALLEIVQQHRVAVGGGEAVECGIEEGFEARARRRRIRAWASGARSMAASSVRGDGGGLRRGRRLLGAAESRGAIEPAGKGCRGGGSRRLLGLTRERRPARHRRLRKPKTRRRAVLKTKLICLRTS